MIEYYNYFLKENIIIIEVACLAVKGFL